MFIHVNDDFVLQIFTDDIPDWAKYVSVDNGCVIAWSGEPVEKYGMWWSFGDLSWCYIKATIKTFSKRRIKPMLFSVSDNKILTVHASSRV